VRRDVENIFLLDKLPLDVCFDTNTAFYDGVEGRRALGLTCAYGTRRHMRARVIEAIVDAMNDQPPITPFTLMKAHEHIANRDLVLCALLVHPKLVPLLARARRPWMGITPKIFVHEDVPIGDLFAFAQPEFVGVVSVTPDGRAGALVTAKEAIVRGQFQVSW
jgi:hypothetical protein